MIVLFDPTRFDDHPEPSLSAVTPTPVYLDNHATTQPDPRVIAAIWEFHTTHYGNPASATHSFGWKARDAVEASRERVAQVLGAIPSSIHFTSGATESNNLAIQGLLASRKGRGDHIVTVATEHPSVLNPLKRLARDGWRLTTLAPIDSVGSIPSRWPRL